MPVFVVVVGLGFFSADIFFYTYLGLAAVLEPAIPIIGLMFVAGMSILGAITYASSLSEALRSGSIRWTLDHFLAPLVGTMFTIRVVLPFYINRLIPFMQSLAHHQSFLDIGVGFCVSILWWVFAFGGPPLAVGAMQSENQVSRLASYAGFLVTASTWGVLLAVAVRAPHG